MLKGKSAITDKEHYNLYNLSIILSWLLHPTKAYGCKSLIARHHCCNKNRVFRLYKLYNTNDKFREFWTDMAFLGMKKGDTFAPFGKLS